MNKSIISLIVLFYILVSTQSIGATDYTKIGVSNGDGFTFFLDEYTLTDNDITTHEMFLGTDERTETELYVSEGEEFRMVVGDETPVINEEEGEATFLVIFETPSNTGQVHESLDGSFISSTDWAGVREEIDSIFTEILSAGENDFTIIDTSSEFGMNVNFTTFESEDYGNFSTDTVTMAVIDVANPIITNTPSDFTVDFGYTGKNITWTATDQTPNTYNITLQGGGTVYGPRAWANGTPITYNIPEDLVAGEYIYTIKFIDDYDNFITDTVTMTINERNSPAIISFGIYFIIPLLFGIILMILRSRKKYHKRRHNQF